MDRIVWKELSHGRVEAASRERARFTLREREAREVDAVILGCTELAMLIQPSDSSCPLIDTMVLHADAILAHAIGN